MRAAVCVTAFLLFGLAVATADSPQHVLPAGTAVVFVSDGRLDAGTRPGSAAVLRLRDPLVLDGLAIAPAGTTARLTVYEYLNAAGHRELGVALEDFRLTAGLLPIRSIEPLQLPVAQGAVIQARTLADVDHLGDRVSIRVPFPFKLSTDRPAAYYTPTPARTASPGSMVPHHRGSPTPVPSSTAAPDASATSPPSPAATKIP